MNLGLALTEMILIALKKKEELLDLRNTMNTRTFLLEHCTVKFSLPRRCGNSTAVKEATDKLSIGFKVLRLYPNSQMNKYHKGDGTVSSFISKPKDCDILIVDSFSFLTYRDVDSLLRVCDDMSHKQRFILAEVQ